MSDTLEISARIGPDGSIRFGESYTVMGQQLIVANGVLEVRELRQYGGFHQEQILVGRFKLEPIP